VDRFILGILTGHVWLIVIILATGPQGGWMLFSKYDVFATFLSATNRELVIHRHKPHRLITDAFHMFISFLTQSKQHKTLNCMKLANYWTTSASSLMRSLKRREDCLQPTAQLWRVLVCAELLQSLFYGTHCSQKQTSTEDFSKRQHSHLSITAQSSRDHSIT